MNTCITEYDTSCKVSKKINLENQTYKSINQNDHIAFMNRLIEEKMPAALSNKLSPSSDFCSSLANNICTIKEKDTRQERSMDYYAKIVVLFMSGMVV